MKNVVLRFACHTKEIAKTKWTIKTYLVISVKQAPTQKNKYPRLQKSHKWVICKQQQQQQKKRVVKECEKRLNDFIIPSIHRLRHQTLPMYWQHLHERWDFPISHDCRCTVCICLDLMFLALHFPKSAISGNKRIKGLTETPSLVWVLN